MIEASQKYTAYFNEAYLMGPNSIRLLDELLIQYPLCFNRENQILDLGCGKGLTSLFLTKETGATIYANDLWIKEEENRKRFSAWNVSDRIFPYCEDANQLTFAPEIFDAVISIDAYHYFAGKKQFFAEKILPYVKKGGIVLIAIPGIKEAYEGQQQSLLEEWLGNEFYMFHSCSWWKDRIGDNTEIEFTDTWEMDNFCIAWEEWLATNNKHALDDKVYYESIIKKYTNFVGIAVKKSR